MDAAPPPLIQALLAPPCYAHPVSQVELMQTHISWVLLAGDYAYKIKKPVRLPFLDFSTLALRRASCLDELRLNRRVAPDIYLGLVAISNTPQAPQLDGPGEPIEYAVKMRRFNEAGRLDHVCARGELQPAHLSDLAETLSVFHNAAAVAAPATRFGSPDAILGAALENFDELQQSAALPGAAQQLAILRAWTEAQHNQLATLMQTRKQSGHVRECHGDLHLGNLVLIDGRVRLFDCIEFNEDLRWIDVINDIAFTYVDLLAHQQSGLANWFVNEVLSRSGDYAAAALLRYYAVYRALVRAKVAMIRRQQNSGDASETLAYLTLAEQLTKPAPPRLLITHGLSGCGKTVASSQLLQSDAQACTLRLRSDVERKRLFGIASNAPSGSPLGGGIYDATAQQQTYARLRELAETLLRQGWSVIVDATFLQRADRDAFRTLADELGLPFQILAPQASPAQLRERILARQAQGHDASEATLAVLERQLRTLEALGADEQAACIQG